MATLAALSAVAPALIAALNRHEFNVDTIIAALGPDVYQAMFRGEPAVVRHATADDSTLSRLIRMILLRDPAPRQRWLELFGPEVLTGLESAGVVRGTNELSLLIDVRPHHLANHHRFIFSDADASMDAHVPDHDHVLGVGAASLSLLQATPHNHVSSLLDLGTGSGVQALAMVPYADKVTATDIHPRAVDLARATFAGAGAEVELLEGGWFDPVAGRRFDKIVANPPFVVGPPEIAHVYRDSGLDLDGASELVISQALEHLELGGTAHILAAWVHQAGQRWQQRVASWLPSRGVDAWFVQRDVADPALYVSTWLRDESVDPRTAAGDARTRRWLEHFESQDVIGIGFGFVSLKNIGDHPSEVLAEEMSQPTDDPLGAEVTEYFARTSWLRGRTQSEIAQARFKVRPHLAKETISVPDPAEGVGFIPAALRLTRTEGPRWSHDVDEALATIVSGLHPEGLTLAETVELYALSHGLEHSTELLPEVVAAVIDLVRHGLLIPADLLAPEDDVSEDDVSADDVGAQ